MDNIIIRTTVPLEVTLILDPETGEYEVNKAVVIDGEVTSSPASDTSVYRFDKNDGEYGGYVHVSAPDPAVMERVERAWNDSEWPSWQFGY